MTASLIGETRPRNGDSASEGCDAWVELEPAYLTVGDLPKRESLTGIAVQPGGGEVDCWTCGRVVTAPTSQFSKEELASGGDGFVASEERCEAWAELEPADLTVGGLPKSEAPTGIAVQSGGGEVVPWTCGRVVTATTSQGSKKVSGFAHEPLKPLGGASTSEVKGDRLVALPPHRSPSDRTPKRVQFIDDGITKGDQVVTLSQLRSPSDRALTRDRCEDGLVSVAGGVTVKQTVQSGPEASGNTLKGGEVMAASRVNRASSDDAENGNLGKTVGIMKSVSRSGDKEVSRTLPSGVGKSIIVPKVEAIVTHNQAKLQRNIIIVAEHIASWALFASVEQGFTVEICCVNEFVWFRRSLKIAHPSLEFSDLCTRIASAPSALVLLQGSVSFCVETIKRLTLVFTQGHSLCCISPERTKKEAKMLDSACFVGPHRLSFTRLVHQELGGVTAERCRISWTQDLVFHRPETDIRRNISSIVKSTELGRRVACPDEISRLSGVIEVQDKLYSRDLVQGQFRLPCVMLSSGFCLRSLLSKEVGTALDFPAASLGSLKVAAAMDKSLLSVLCSLPPGKVVQAAAHGFWAIPSDGRVFKGVTSQNRVFDPLFIDADMDYEAVEARDVKAAKADDAEANFDLWNLAIVNWDGPDDSSPLVCKGILTPGHVQLFDMLRLLCYKQYRKNLVKSFWRYLKGFYSPEVILARKDINLSKDMDSARDSIERAVNASFWNWDDGSTQFFWRWQPTFHQEVRDGTPAFIYWDKMPKCRTPQRPQADEAVRKQEFEKLDKVVRRRYLAPKLVLSLTGYFSIPKGEGDIRMVYDATKCKLNDALWAPNFWLPNMDNVADCATSSSYFGDIDCGEMFLNFMLDPRLRPYAGVDLTQAYQQKGVRGLVRIWKRWERTGMGFRNSPYVAIRQCMIAQEIIMGDHTDPSNPFFWSKIMVNYPGTETYKPHLPRVYKYNRILDTIANDIKGFVDDFRGVGSSLVECQRVLHTFASNLQYLGIQDAPRKRRVISQRPGAWTGSVMLTIPQVGVFVKCMDAKWAKTQSILAHYDELHSLDDHPKVPLKQLERDVGFLIHIAQTYPAIKPYLRSFYGSMNSWRRDRNVDGWKLRGTALQSFYEANGSPWAPDSDEDSEVVAPVEVQLVPMFQNHIQALRSMFHGDIPALRLVRGEIIHEVGYGFGDASGSGFGASWLEDSKVVYRVGVWNDEGKGTSSNYRELRNLTESLEDMGDRGNLEGVELFFFTDNSVSESVAFKANSTSPILFKLMLRIKLLEMKYRCKIHIVHVAGTRMIAQGTDGISRGDMYEGVLRGDSMLSHVPLGRSALERSPKLKEWIASWAEKISGQCEFLQEEDWFMKGHDIVGGSKNCDDKWIPRYKHGVYIWTPAPAGANIAAQELRKARHKRTDSLHIFVCPRLLSHEWSAQISKTADLLVTIPIGTQYWNNDMHEPLRLAICFPFARVSPWQLKGCKAMVDMGRLLSQMWKEGSGTEGDLLCELCCFAWGMEDMPIHMLREVLFGRSIDPFPCLQGRRGESAFMEEKSEEQ